MRIRDGYDFAEMLRIYTLLGREGNNADHIRSVKRVYRLYKEEGLNLRNKPPITAETLVIGQPIIDWKG
ncbi:hypothetical protein QNI16_37120 [Cytophagaceae bacterium YF14B1]|uniref:Uncharacterized protein n=1 Tax=Xanthocytophaga flava TaxID=3048013 RepID=A0AAE3UAI4_9BACT|nr:hypothetical protein [Xanthocytophaga flavus]MDJ1486151.1 hypothetical protein [Xanthocytophaga flavus]MDJ1486164.1 hypothetical protein [Xanthocytophaga flavus]